MATSTTRPSTEAEPLPLDVETMRESARRLLADGAEEPPPEELGTLAVLLRDHIRQLIPEVAAAMLGLPKDDVPKACAQACIGEAQMRLRLGDGDNGAVRLAVAVRLARSVNALCDHLTNLGGVS
jgi:hypothetical protein